jgi:GDP-L-fucose synthase
LRRFHEAKVNNEECVEVWGTGKARREFMHVDDLASACLFVLENVEAAEIYGQGISCLNVGSGDDISIAELAELIKKVVEYKGEIKFDLDQPDGTLKKLMDSSRLEGLGWESKITLEEGLRGTYNWYRENCDGNIKK